MTTNHLAHIADRVINRPLLILPDKLAIIGEMLAGRIGIDASALAADASRFAGTARQGEAYRTTRNGVAIIPVLGSLVNRGAWIGAQSGLTSYEGLSHQLQTAARDPKVRSIILDIDSPGGEATGAFETAALVRKVSQAKPVYAMVNGMAASAAYALASGAKAIISTESAIAGSIGVVLMHADYSRAIDKAGITPTLIHAGAMKVDGNPYQPLPKTVRANLQREVDDFYKMFLQTVAAGRGARLTADAAKATEARTFIGETAKKAGLTDDIGSFDELLTHLNKAPSGAKPKGITTMIDPHIFDDDFGNAPAAVASNAGEPAAFDAAYQKGIETGKEIGARAERARIGTLLSLPAAQADLKAAIKVALDPGATASSIADGIKSTAASRQAEIDRSWQEAHAAIAKEDKANLTNTAAPPQAGALSVDDVMAKVNAEARHGGL